MNTITLAEAARLLGVPKPASARRALDRAGIKAIGREPGRSGQSLYDREEVESLQRPGQGARTDLAT